METKRIKRVVLQFAVVLLLILMVFPSAFAAAKGTNPAQLKITSVTVGPELTSLTINGANFKKAKGPLVVSLGGDSIQIDNYTDNALTANFPAGLTAGDYLLTVTTGNGATDYDEYNLTIGGTGTPGPQGPPGKDGTNGTIDRATLQVIQCDGVNICSCGGQKVILTYGVQCLQPGMYGESILETSGSYTEPIIADPISGYGGVTGIKAAYCWYNWGAGVPKYYESAPPEKIWLVCF
jgi:hypothetical protein